MWPTMTFLLLGCSLVMSSGGSYVDELQHKISSANECIQRLVDCSATYSPLAVNEIDGSFFQDPVDLERACRKNTFYINCVERTKRYCEQQNIGEVETAMIKNRLWIKDLCAANSKWKKLYVMHSECVIRESFTYRKECTLHQKPVDPRYIGLEDLCRYFKGIVDCTAYVVKRECGDQASELFRRISMMKGNREYLCPDSKRPESPQLQATKQMLRNVRSLMSNMSSIVKATLSEEDAAYVLQELDPQEVERIKKLFRSKSGIQYGESPLFEMQDLVDEGHEEDEFPSRDEYSIQIIEVHTAKRIKDTIGVDYVKSQQEEKIENLEKSYVVDWSSQLNQNYKSEDVDYPGDIVHLVQKAEVDYPEGLELDASVHHNSKDPEYWNDLTPHPETYDKTDSMDSYYSEPHSHLIQKDDPDESSEPQLSDAVKSEDIEVYAELKDSDQVFILEDGIDGDLSCKRLYHRLPEDPAFESNASFHVYKIQNHGKTHLGSGQTMVKWKTMSDTPLDDLFCSWLDPGASRTLFKCAIKLTELKHKTEELREPRPHPILLALYASNAADGFPMQLTEVATFCVENYNPSEEEPLSNSKLREYLHCRKDGKEMETADSLEVDGVKKRQLEDCDESHLKHSIQKRVLEVLQDESSEDPLDRNLSLFKEQLPEQIKDVEEKFGSLLDRKLSDPFKMYPSLSEVAAGEGDDSFHETSCPPKMNDCKIGNFLTGCPPEIVDALKDSNTGKIPTTVSTTLKPGVYIDVTSLESTNSLKFGKENVNYIVVGNRPTKSTLAASDHFVPEPISFGFLDAEQFIKNGIDSIRADQAAESVQE